jgi:hypothetical protein
MRKTIPERDDDRPTEDDLAQAHLGGPKGYPQGEPAPMTPQRKKKTPRVIVDPGHTA